MRFLKTILDEERAYLERRDWELRGYDAKCSKIGNLYELVVDQTEESIRRYGEDDPMLDPHRAMSLFRRSNPIWELGSDRSVNVPASRQPEAIAVSRQQEPQIREQDVPARSFPPIGSLARPDTDRFVADESIIYTAPGGVPEYGRFVAYAGNGSLCTVVFDRGDRQRTVSVSLIERCSLTERANARLERERLDSATREALSLWDSAERELRQNVIRVTPLASLAKSGDFVKVHLEGYGLICGIVVLEGDDDCLHIHVPLSAAIVVRYPRHVVEKITANEFSLMTGVLQLPAQSNRVMAALHALRDRAPMPVQAPVQEGPLEESSVVGDFKRTIDI